jgi:uncharacterized protein YecT (DUF1311 family)
MASAAQEFADDDDVIEETGPRDFEAEARTMGWVPKDEFRGDPARHVEAQAFVERGENEMPLLKAQLKRLKSELDTVKRDSRKVVAQFTAAEEKAYKRAMADLETRAAEATEAGDQGAVKAIMREAQALAPPDKPGEPSLEEAQEAWDTYRDDNRWYDRADLQSATDLEKDARVYYDKMTTRHLKKTETMAPADFFAYIDGLVKEEFPDLTKARPKANGSRLAPEVAGQGARRSSRGSKTFEDLPRQAQEFCDKLIRQKMMPNRAAYLAAYDWS